MPTSVQEVTLFISSPSDQLENRNLAEEVAGHVNRMRGNKEGFYIRVVRWENDARPGVGAEPQILIDRQLGTEFDIYVGFMGAKFGTATSKAGSGTEQEFNNALQSCGEGNREVLFYFQDPRHATEVPKASELAKVEEFQSKLRELDVLYWKFSSTEELKNQLTKHISDAVDGVLTNTTQRTVKEASNQTVSKHSSFDPLANLNALDDSEEEGMFELSEKVEKNADMFSAEMDTISSHTTNLGNKFQILINATTELTAKAPSEFLKSRKRIFALTAKYMEDFTSGVADSLPKMHDYFGQVLDATNSMLLLSKQSRTENQEDLELLDSALNVLIGSLREVAPSVGSFKAEVQNLPKMTSQISRSKRRMLAITDDLLMFIDLATEQLEKLRAEATA